MQPSRSRAASTTNNSKTPLEYIHPDLPLVVSDTRFEHVSGTWTLQICRGDKGVFTLDPASRSSYWSRVAGSETRNHNTPKASHFEGKCMHSTEFVDGRAWLGRKAIVIGAGLLQTLSHTANNFENRYICVCIAKDSRLWTIFIVRLNKLIPPVRRPMDIVPAEFNCLMEITGVSTSSATP